MFDEHIQSFIRKIVSFSYNLYTLFIEGRVAKYILLNIIPSQSQQKSSLQRGILNAFQAFDIKSEFH